MQLPGGGSSLADCYGVSPFFYRILVTCYPQANVCVYTLTTDKRSRPHLESSGCSREEAGRGSEGGGEEEEEGEGGGAGGGKEGDVDVLRNGVDDGDRGVGVDQKTESLLDEVNSNDEEKEKNKKKGEGADGPPGASTSRRRVGYRVIPSSLHFPYLLDDTTWSDTSNDYDAEEDEEDEDEDGEDDADASSLFSRGKRTLKASRPSSSSSHASPPENPFGLDRSGGGPITPSTIAASRCTPSILLQSRPKSLRPVYIHFDAVLSLPVRGSASTCSLRHFLVGCARQPALLFLPLDGLRTVQGVIYLSDLIPAAPYTPPRHPPLRSSHLGSSSPASSSPCACEGEDECHTQTRRRRETGIEEERTSSCPNRTIPQRRLSSDEGYDPLNIGFDQKNAEKYKPYEEEGAATVYRRGQSRDEEEEEEEEKWCCCSQEGRERAGGPEDNGACTSSHRVCYLYSPLGHETVQEILQHELRTEDVVLLPDLPDGALRGDVSEAREAHRNLQELLRFASEARHVKKRTNEAWSGTTTSSSFSPTPSGRSGHRFQRPVCQDEGEERLEKDRSEDGGRGGGGGGERGEQEGGMKRSGGRALQHRDRHRFEESKMPSSSLLRTLHSLLTYRKSESCGGEMVTSARHSSAQGRRGETDSLPRDEDEVEPRGLPEFAAALSEGICQLDLNVRLGFLGVVTTRGRFLLLSWELPLVSYRHPRDFRPDGTGRGCRKEGDPTTEMEREGDWKTKRKAFLDGAETVGERPGVGESGVSNEEFPSKGVEKRKTRGEEEKNRSEAEEEEEETVENKRKKEKEMRSEQGSERSKPVETAVNGIPENQQDTMKATAREGGEEETSGKTAKRGLERGQMDESVVLPLEERKQREQSREQEGQGSRRRGQRGGRYFSPVGILVRQDKVMCCALNAERQMIALGLSSGLVELYAVDLSDQAPHLDAPATAYNDNRDSGYDRRGGDQKESGDAFSSRGGRRHEQAYKIAGRDSSPSSSRSVPRKRRESVSPSSSPTPSLETPRVRRGRCRYHHQHVRLLYTLDYWGPRGEEEEKKRTPPRSSSVLSNTTKRDRENPHTPTGSGREREKERTASKQERGEGEGSSSSAKVAVKGGEEASGCTAGSRGNKKDGSPDNFRFSPESHAAETTSGQSFIRKRHQRRGETPELLSFLAPSPSPSPLYPSVESMAWSDDGLALVVKWEDKIDRTKTQSEEQGAGGGAGGRRAYDRGEERRGDDEDDCLDASAEGGGGGCVAVFSYTGRLLLSPFPPAVFAESSQQEETDVPSPLHREPAPSPSAPPRKVFLSSSSRSSLALPSSPQQPSRPGTSSGGALVGREEDVRASSVSARDSTAVSQAHKSGERDSGRARRASMDTSPIPPSARPHTCAWTGLGLGLLISQTSTKRARETRKQALFNGRGLCKEGRADQEGETGSRARLGDSSDRKSGAGGLTDMGGEEKSNGDWKVKQQGGQTNEEEMKEKEEKRRLMANLEAPQIFEISIYRSAWLGVGTTAVDGAGSRASSDSGDRILVGSSCFLQWQSLPYLPPSLSWSRIPYPPPMYTSPNWPIRQATLSPHQDFLLVNGTRGFALYSLSQKRWRMLGNEQEEREMPTGLLPQGWYDCHIFFVCIQTYNPNLSPALAALAASAPLPVSSLHHIETKGKKADQAAGFFSSLFFPAHPGGQDNASSGKTGGEKEGDRRRKDERSVGDTDLVVMTVPGEEKKDGGVVSSPSVETEQQSLLWDEDDSSLGSSNGAESSRREDSPAESEDTQAASREDLQSSRMSDARRLVSRPNSVFPSRCHSNSPDGVPADDDHHYLPQSRETVLVDPPPSLRPPPASSTRRYPPEPLPTWKGERGTCTIVDACLTRQVEETPIAIQRILPTGGLLAIQERQAWEAMVAWKERFAAFKYGGDKRGGGRIGVLGGGGGGEEERRRITSSSSCGYALYFFDVRGRLGLNECVGVVRRLPARPLRTALLSSSQQRIVWRQKKDDLRTGDWTITRPTTREQREHRASQEGRRGEQRGREEEEEEKSKKTKRRLVCCLCGRVVALRSVQRGPRNEENDGGVRTEGQGRSRRDVERIGESHVICNACRRTWIMERTRWWHPSNSSAPSCFDSSSSSFFPPLSHATQEDNSSRGKEENFSVLAYPQSAYHSSDQRRYCRRMERSPILAVYDAHYLITAYQLQPPELSSFSSSLPSFSLSESPTSPDSSFSSSSVTGLSLAQQRGVAPGLNVPKIDVYDVCALWQVDVSHCWVDHPLQLRFCGSPFLLLVLHGTGQVTALRLHEKKSRRRGEGERGSGRTDAQRDRYGWVYGDSDEFHARERRDKNLPSLSRSKQPSTMNGDGRHKEETAEADVHHKNTRRQQQSSFLSSWFSVPSFFSSSSSSLSSSSPPATSSVSSASLGSPPLLLPPSPLSSSSSSSSVSLHLIPQLEAAQSRCIAWGVTSLWLDVPAQLRSFCPLPARPLFVFPGCLEEDLPSPDASTDEEDVEQVRGDDVRPGGPTDRGAGREVDEDDEDERRLREEENLQRKKEYLLFSSTCSSCRIGHLLWKKRRRRRRRRRRRVGGVSNGMDVGGGPRRSHCRDLSSSSFRQESSASGSFSQLRTLLHLNPCKLHDGPGERKGSSSSSSSYSSLRYSNMPIPRRGGGGGRSPGGEREEGEKGRGEGEKEDPPVLGLRCGVEQRASREGRQESKKGNSQESFFREISDKTVECLSSLDLPPSRHELMVNGELVLDTKTHPKKPPFPHTHLLLCPEEVSSLSSSPPLLPLSSQQTAPRKLPSSSPSLGPVSKKPPPLPPVGISQSSSPFSSRDQLPSSASQGDMSSCPSSPRSSLSLPTRTTNAGKSLLAARTPARPSRMRSPMSESSSLQNFSRTSAASPLSLHTPSDERRKSLLLLPMSVDHSSSSLSNSFLPNGSNNTLPSSSSSPPFPPPLERTVSSPAPSSSSPLIVEKKFHQHPPTLSEGMNRLTFSYTPHRLPGFLLLPSGRLRKGVVAVGRRRRRPLVNVSQYQRVSGDSDVLSRGRDASPVCPPPRHAPQDRESSHRFHGFYNNSSNDGLRLASSVPSSEAGHYQGRVRPLLQIDGARAPSSLQEGEGLDDREEGGSFLRRTVSGSVWETWGRTRKDFLLCLDDERVGDVGGQGGRGRRKGGVYASVAASDRGLGSQPDNGEEEEEDEDDADLSSRTPLSSQASSYGGGEHLRCPFTPLPTHPLPSMSTSRRTKGKRNSLLSGGGESRSLLMEMKMTADEEDSPFSSSSKSSTLRPSSSYPQALYNVPLLKTMQSGKTEDRSFPRREGGERGGGGGGDQEGSSLGVAHEDPTAEGGERGKEGGDEEGARRPRIPEEKLLGEETGEGSLGVSLGRGGSPPQAARLSVSPAEASESSPVEGCQKREDEERDRADVGVRKGEGDGGRQCKKSARAESKDAGERGGRQRGEEQFEGEVVSAENGEGEMHRDDEGDRGQAHDGKLLQSRHCRRVFKGSAVDKKEEEKERRDTRRLSFRAAGEGGGGDDASCCCLGGVYVWLQDTDGLSLVSFSFHYHPPLPSSFSPRGHVEHLSERKAEDVYESTRDEREREGERRREERGERESDRWRESKEDGGYGGGVLSSSSSFSWGPLYDERAVDVVCRCLPLLLPIEQRPQPLHIAGIYSALGVVVACSPARGSLPFSSFSSSSSVHHSVPSWPSSASLSSSSSSSSRQSFVKISSPCIDLRLQLQPCLHPLIGRLLAFSASSLSSSSSVGHYPAASSFSSSVSSQTSSSSSSSSLSPCKSLSSPPPSSPLPTMLPASPTSTTASSLLRAPTSSAPPSGCCSRPQALSEAVEVLLHHLRTSPFFTHLIELSLFDLFNRVLPFFSREMEEALTQLKKNSLPGGTSPEESGLQTMTVKKKEHTLSTSSSSPSLSTSVLPSSSFPPRVSSSSSSCSPRCYSLSSSSGLAPSPGTLEGDALSPGRKKTLLVGGRRLAGSDTSSRDLFSAGRGSEGEKPSREREKERRSLEKRSTKGRGGGGGGHVVSSFLAGISSTERRVQHAPVVVTSADQYKQVYGNRGGIDEGYLLTLPQHSLCHQTVRQSQRGLLPAAMETTPPRALVDQQPSPFFSSPPSSSSSSSTPFSVDTRGLKDEEQSERAAETASTTDVGEEEKKRMKTMRRRDGERERGGEGRAEGEVGGEDSEKEKRAVMGKDYQNGRKEVRNDGYLDAEGDAEPMPTCSSRPPGTTKEEEGEGGERRKTGGEGASSDFPRSEKREEEVEGGGVRRKSGVREGRGFAPQTEANERYRESDEETKSLQRHPPDEVASRKDRRALVFLSIARLLSGDPGARTAQEMDSNSSTRLETSLQSTREVLVSLPGGLALYLLLRLLASTYPATLRKVMASCIRKTEPVKAPLILFPLLGMKPAQLFLEALDRRLLHTASLYLLVLQNTEGPLRVRQHRALPLLKATLEIGVFGLAKKLIRFILTLVSGYLVGQKERKGELQRHEEEEDHHQPARREREDEVSPVHWPPSSSSVSSSSSSPVVRLPWSGEGALPRLWAPQVWRANREKENRGKKDVIEEEEERKMRERRAVMKGREQEEDEEEGGKKAREEETQREGPGGGEQEGGGEAAEGRHNMLPERRDVEEEAHVEEESLMKRRNHTSQDIVLWDVEEDSKHITRSEVLELYRQLEEVVAESVFSSFKHLQWLRLFHLTAALALDLPAWLVPFHSALAQLFTLRSEHLLSHPASFPHLRPALSSSPSSPSPSGSATVRTPLPFEKILRSFVSQLLLGGGPHEVCTFFSPLEWKSTLSLFLYSSPLVTPTKDMHASLAAESSFSASPSSSVSTATTSPPPPPASLPHAHQCPSSSSLQLSTTLPPSSSHSLSPSRSCASLTKGQETSSGQGGDAGTAFSSSSPGRFLAEPHRSMPTALQVGMTREDESNSMGEADEAGEEYKSGKIRSHTEREKQVRRVSAVGEEELGDKKKKKKQQRQDQQIACKPPDCLSSCRVYPWGNVSHNSTALQPFLLTFRSSFAHSLLLRDLLFLDLSTIPPAFVSSLSSPPSSLQRGGGKINGMGSFSSRTLVKEGGDYPTGEEGHHHKSMLPNRYWSPSDKSTPSSFPQRHRTSGGGSSVPCGVHETRGEREGLAFEEDSFCQPAFVLSDEREGLGRFVLNSTKENIGKFLLSVFLRVDLPVAVLALLTGARDARGVQTALLACPGLIFQILERKEARKHQEERVIPEAGENPKQTDRRTQERAGGGGGQERQQQQQQQGDESQEGCDCPSSSPPPRLSSQTTRVSQEGRTETRTERDKQGEDGWESLSPSVEAWLCRQAEEALVKFRYVEESERRAPVALKEKKKGKGRGGGGGEQRAAKFPRELDE